MHRLEAPHDMTDTTEPKKCLTCSRPAAPGYVRCDACRESQRMQHAARVELGLCRSCAAPLPTGCTVQHCDMCRAAAAELRRQRRARGECERCGAPSGVATYCDVCLAKRKAARDRRKAARCS